MNNKDVKGNILIKAKAQFEKFMIQPESYHQMNSAIVVVFLTDYKNC